MPIRSWKCTRIITAQCVRFERGPRGEKKNQKEPRAERGQKKTHRECYYLTTIFDTVSVFPVGNRFRGFGQPWRPSSKINGVIINPSRGTDSGRQNRRWSATVRAGPTVSFANHWRANNHNDNVIRTIVMLAVRTCDFHVINI